MVTLKEADNENDSKTLLNGAEVENDEQDLLIDKSDRFQAETITDQNGIKWESSNFRSNILSSKLNFYFNQNNSTNKINQDFSHHSKNKQSSNFWKTITNAPASLRSSQRLHYNFSNLTQERGKPSKLETNQNYCDNDYDDDELLRCIKTRGNKYSIKRKLHIFFTSLVAIILIFTFIYLLIKLVILAEEHRNFLDYQHNDWKFTTQFGEHSGEEDKLKIESDQYYEGKSFRWLVSSPKCHVPVIDPWHESIKTYVNVKNNINCQEISKQAGYSQYALSYISNNRLYFNNDRALAIDNSLFDDCCYRQISRSDENDDDLIYNETCNPIEINGNKNQAFKIPFELIKLECTKLNYTNFHSFIVHVLEEEEAFKIVAEKKLNKDQYYNVLLVGMDTISRLNGHRQLNKTLDILKTTYKTIEFYGYNKVGENTFPNLIPLLTGLKATQLTETQCWLPTNYTDEGESGDDYLDNCKYLWNYYQELGYVTYFSEDWSTFSTFNYLKPGFKRKPTLFYGRPFAKARKSLLLPKSQYSCSMCILDKPTVEIDLANLRNFVKEQQNSPHFALHWINCPQHDDLNGASQVDYIVRNFFEEIHDLVSERTFIFFFSDHGYRWNDFVSTRIGHYEASLPLLTIAPPRHFIDNHPDLYENLKHHQKALITPFDVFKTLIAIRNLGAKSHQVVSGQKRFASDKTNDFSNNHTKTTKLPIEIAIISTSPTASTTVKQLQQVDGLSYKQDFKVFSLLDKHSDSELDRSCIDAGIPDNYCVCHEFNKINSNSMDVKGAAYYLVYVHFYNQIRDSQDICELLDLESINESQMFDFKRMKSLSTSRERRSTYESKQNSSTILNKSTESPDRSTSPPKTTFKEIVIDDHHFLPNREYNIRVTTNPGLGLFQEVVRYHGSDIENCKTEVRKAEGLLMNPQKNRREKYDIVMKMNQVCKFSVHSDSISRLNLYKGQSDCVTNNIELRKICYCRHQ